MHASPRLLLFAVLSSLYSSSASPTHLSTFEVVARGRTCSQSTIDPRQTDCVFRVGKDLWFSIAGTGTRDAGIAFMKADIDGDYYASFGLRHGCVIVWPGRQLPSAKVTDLAFVSPVNGRVYRSWESCAQHD